MQAMREIPIHFAPLAAAALTRMVLGALWYSPMLFLRAWHRVSGVSEAEMNAGIARAVAVDLVGSLVMAFVLLHAVKYAGAPRPRHKAGRADSSTGSASSRG